MFNRWQNLCISWVLAVLACSAMLGISAAYADICFLPSMECFDPAAGTAPDSSPDDNCDGFNLSNPKSGDGWTCDECGGKYKCECLSGYVLKNGNCVKHEGECSDSEYKYTYRKSSPWLCYPCTDSTSHNYGKYRCECGAISYNGECVEDPCDANEYTYSSSGVATMRANGYTCDKCNYSYSENYGKYACYCPSGKQVDGDGNCVDIKNCSSMYETKAACESAINGETHKTCEPVGECYDWTIYCNNDAGEYKTQAACESASSPYACKLTSDQRCYIKSDQKQCLYTDADNKVARGYTCDSCVRGGKTYYGNCKCNKEFEQAKDKSGTIYCYSCEDENDTANPCYGKYHCKSRIPVGEVTCSCPFRIDNRTVSTDIKYYNKCLVEETCNGDSQKINGVDHDASTSSTSYTYSGYYYTGVEKCKTVDLKPYYWWAKCDGVGTDAAGNTPPASGLKDCTDSAGIGKGVECGRRKYYQSCDACNGGSQTINGVDHDATTSSTWHSDTFGAYYYTGVKKCSTSDGSKTYYWWARCNDVGTDVAGNTPPASGKKECGSNEIGYPEDIKCGTSHFGVSCVKECNYNYRQSDCPNTFKMKCQDSDGVVWGECP